MFVVTDLTPEEQQLLETIRERKQKLLEEIQVRSMFGFHFPLDFPVCGVCMIYISVFLLFSNMLRFVHLDIMIIRLFL